MGYVLSIVIPTYDRKDTLQMSLRAILIQEYPVKDVEILVVDDGSTDGTEALVRGIARGSKFAIKYFRQENKGPAAARNIGIKNAKGRIVLFLGDDIVAGPGLLEEHGRWHQIYPEENIAVLGLVTWSPAINVTDFMKWLENGGPQFDYNAIGSGCDAHPEKFFYSSNISLKREFMLYNGLFDEDFKFAAYEDIELGSRLAKKGLAIKFNRAAVGYHHHCVDMAGYSRRQYNAGISAVLYEKKVSGTTEDCAGKAKMLDTLYFKAKMIFCRAMKPLFQLPGLDMLRYRCYKIELEASKLQGIKKGLEMYGN